MAAGQKPRSCPQSNRVRKHTTTRYLSRRSLRSYICLGQLNEAEAFMRLHEFMAGGRTALTSDHTGANLPGDGWVLVEDAEINEDSRPRAGASSAEIIAGVGKHGYFILPVTKPDDASRS